jgi:hypothetical protein
MQKINFENLPSTNTPINATNLNAIQDNTESAINSAINSVISTIASLISVDYLDDIEGSITIGNIGIEWGVVQVTPSYGSSPNFYGSVQVNFKNTYKKAPGMFANLGAGYTSVQNVATINVGNTSGNVWMTASVNTARNCRYFVIGQIDDSQ